MNLQVKSHCNLWFFGFGIAGVTLYGGARAVQLLKLPKATSFHVEYSALACTLEVVKDVGAAIDHIHKHGRWFSEFC